MSIDYSKLSVKEESFFSQKQSFFFNGNLMYLTPDIKAKDMHQI